jgi:hypothetical protein
MNGPDLTMRRKARPLDLLRQAAGSPRAMADKIRRFAAIPAAYADGAELDARLRRLHEIGIVEEIPTRIQLAVGAYDMLRFWISPAAADYYARIGIDYTFHQILRVLDEPASLADPVGFFSTRDGIIGHLMQVVHANPVYDLELLQMFDDGLDALEAQLNEMLAGTHPRAAAIGAIVEEPDYHARLLAFVRAYRNDSSVPPLLRDNIAPGGFSALERTFGSLRGAMRYFRRMPDDARGAVLHVLTVKEFPYALAEA